MSGLSDYAAGSNLAFCTGQIGKTAPTSLWLALFTVPPTSDAGTGGTEVSGGSYARPQIAGQLAMTGSTSTSLTTFTLTSNAPQWLVSLGTSSTSSATGGTGVTVWTTAGVFVGTIATNGASTSSTTITLTSNAAVVTSTNIQFSAFSAPAASTGNPEPNTLPSSITNGASVPFVQATASWGTVVGFGIYDTLASATNLYAFDYLGNFKWIPFSCTSASPGVLTTDLSADVPVNGSICAVTQKYGATLPTTAGSWSYPLTSAGSSANTFNLGVNTSTTGGGLFRQVLQQPIAINVTASFAASALTITSA